MSIIFYNFMFKDFEQSRNKTIIILLDVLLSIVTERFILTFIAHSYKTNLIILSI